MAQSLTVLIAAGLSVHTLSRPRFVLMTIRARTRQAICFEIICCESANGSVNPCTEAGPCESRSIMALRVGSDNAANVVPSLSTTIWLWIAVKCQLICCERDFHSLVSEPLHRRVIDRQCTH